MCLRLLKTEKSNIQYIHKLWRKYLRHTHFWIKTLNSLQFTSIFHISSRFCFCFFFLVFIFISCLFCFLFLPHNIHQKSKWSSFPHLLCFYARIHYISSWNEFDVTEERRKKKTPWKGKIIRILSEQLNIKNSINLIFLVVVCFRVNIITKYFEVKIK